MRSALLVSVCACGAARRMNNNFLKKDAIQIGTSNVRVGVLTIVLTCNQNFIYSYTVMK